MLTIWDSFHRCPSKQEMQSSQTNPTPKEKWRTSSFVTYVFSGQRAASIHRNLRAGWHRELWQVDDYKYPLQPQLSPSPENQGKCLKRNEETDTASCQRPSRSCPLRHRLLNLSSHSCLWQLWLLESNQRGIFLNCFQFKCCTERVAKPIRASYW